MALVNNPIDIIVDKDISINSSIIDNTGYTFDMTFTVDTQTRKQALTEYITNQGATSVEYKNGLNILTYQLPRLSIPLSQDIVLSIAFSLDEDYTPQQFKYDLFKILGSDYQLNQLTELLKQYVIIEPLTLWENNVVTQDILLSFALATQNSITISYPTINNNGNKSFIIKLVNITTGEQIEFTAKTTTNKDNTESSYVVSGESSPEDVELLEKINKVIITPNYEPYKLNVQVKEVV